MKPEDRKRLKQHIEMIVEHKEPDEIVRENFKKLQDEVADLREKNIKLRLELSTLRFKESQEQRFIWWVREVFAKNVQDTVAGIIEACTYQDEPTAAAGKYGLPIKCFEMMRRLTESTHGIYDGTYLDVEISAVVKNQKSLGDEVMEIIQAALSGDCQKYLSYDLQGNKYCKWGIVEKDIRALFETSTDNNKRSNWKAMHPGFAAPAVNKRYLVKLINDWICIATYVGGGYWKNDSGQELADGVVSLWKGLEE